ncbi:MAG TPA: hypothetical protein VLF95_09980 [Vicinamibacteria bacterium]|nr:hypothetical protein [Vicinamibacteria bacterium]
MIERLRRAFNASWTESAYAAYKARLAEAVGSRIGFRLCESPVFLPPDLRDAMVRGALEIWDQLLQPAALERSKDAVPPEFDVPGSDDHPLFAQADFAIVEADGRLGPRLIELQGFPSLYAFQLLQGRLCLEMMPGEDLDYLLGGLDDAGYRRVVSDAILGGVPAENVVLLDLDPPGQGTYPDFAATERLFGIRAVCPTEVTKRGRELWYERDGRPTRILRVYNRLIVDELVEKGIELPFRFTEELDVQWAGHPNWFFRWSKHALPGLRHPFVPEARLLSDFDSVPDDLDRWVLKPLFSFSGTGVKVDVTAADLAAVPEHERGATLLMRKVDYAPVVEAADGGRSRVEVRVMFVWRGGQPVPVTTLARLSRGRMMGVKFNRDRTWVGSTSCLWPRH